MVFLFLLFLLRPITTDIYFSMEAGIYSKEANNKESTILARHCFEPFTILHCENTFFILAKIDKNANNLKWST